MEPLPDELLLKILHHLGPEDLILASQVSETWNRVARDSTMWKQVALTVRNFPNSTNIQSYVARVIGRCPAFAFFSISRYSLNEKARQYKIVA